MLPENDPHRMASARTLQCYKCAGLIPPTIPFYDHGGRVCCVECHSKPEIEMQPGGVYYGDRTGVYVISEPDPEWPEDLGDV